MPKEKDERNVGSRLKQKNKNKKPSVLAYSQLSPTQSSSFSFLHKVFPLAQLSN